MTTEETTITELELAEEVLADMVIPVDTSTDTKSVSLKQLRAWLGSSLPTGFILPAVGKINDERFTLLDGKTLSKQGTYGAFCAKVEAEVQAGNWLACTEEEYNADITAYNQCGKFVIGVDYVRIPTITRFIGATITLSEIGKTYKESLPNITGHFYTLGGHVEAGGAFKVTVNNQSGSRSGIEASYWHRDVGMDFIASRSSSTYQDGAKVQPDHTKYPYYMVVSTEGQTENVEIDVNQVYEDLNLKANSNLSNLTAEGKSLASGLAMPSNKYIDLTFGANHSTYTAPANGWFAVQKVCGVNAGYIYFINQANKMGTEYATASSSYTAKIFIPVKKGDIVEMGYNMTGKTEIFRFIYAEGEN